MAGRLQSCAFRAVMPRCLSRYSQFVLIDVFGFVALVLGQPAVLPADVIHFSPAFILT